MTDSSRSSEAYGPGTEAPAEARPARRDFLGLCAGGVMACGLAGGYGAFGGMAVRYLYPAADAPKSWQYVARLASLGPGASVLYHAPSGQTINVARKGEGDSADDFIALSSVCPHLGCQVYWESDRNRFFCPCHNGVFDPDGLGTEGPPKGQSLLRYPLKVENGLLFVEAPVERLDTGAPGRNPGGRSGR